MNLKQKLIAGTISGIVGLVSMLGCESYKPRGYNSTEETAEKFYELNISAKTANKYDITFDEDDVVFLVKKKISPESANAYSEAFKNISSKDIDYLIKHNISPETAKAYVKIFGAQYNGPVSSTEPVGWTGVGPKHIEYLIKHNISPETAEAYIEAFDSSYINFRTSSFRKNKPLVIRDYMNERIANGLPVNIASFVENNISPKDILELNGTFKESDIPEYSTRFNFVDLYHLIKSNISPDESFQYHIDASSSWRRDLSGFGIAECKRRGIDISSENKGLCEDSWLKRSDDIFWNR